MLQTAPQTLHIIFSTTTLQTQGDHILQLLLWKIGATKSKIHTGKGGP